MKRTNQLVRSRAAKQAVCKKVQRKEDRATPARHSIRCLGTIRTTETATECSARARVGFTMVELVVSLSVIAVLAALILPAIAASREAARRTECRNKLKQIGIATQAHITQYQHFPTNGWGFQWVGDPDRGAGRRQPGGWVFNLLPFLELQNLYEMGRGLPFAVKRNELAWRAVKTAPLFVCPSRPADELGFANKVFHPVNADWVPVVAKTHYAINEGNFITGTGPGPDSFDEGDSGTFKWTPTDKANGVSFLRSTVYPAHVLDGLSNTLLVGEKYVSTLGYSNADDPGFDQSLFSGVDWDVNRWTHEPPLPDASEQHPRRFGSAHAEGCHVVYCDGRVEMLSWTIDAKVFRAAGDRNGGFVGSQ